MKLHPCVLLPLFLLFGACFSSSRVCAVPLLATDFAGRTVDGLTARDIPWTLNGIANPGDLTAVDTDQTGILLALFDSGDSADRFVPDMNIHNEGPWHVDVPLTIVGGDLDVVRLDVSYGIFSNAGNLQGAPRDADLTATILDSAGTEISSGELLDFFPNDGALDANPASVQIDLTPVTLTLGDEYILRILVSGEGPGNNAGLDSISLEGAVAGGADPLLVVQPSINLGQVLAFPETIQGTFPIANQGANETLMITAINVTGEHSANFEILADFPISIEPSGSADISYQFNSMGNSADYSAVFEIDSNNALGEQTDVTISVLVDAPGGDTDRDGLTDEEEAQLETDGFLPDTDGDGLSDGDEVNTHNTNPKKADSDDDGFSDAVEIAADTDPNDPNDFPSVLLSTDFEGRTVDGLTAGDIPWQTNGILDPGDLTAVDTDDTGILAMLFDTDAAQGAFVPDMNLHNEGPWHVDIPLTILDADAVLKSLEIGIGIFNNGGSLQGVGRDVDLAVSVLDPGGNVLGSGEALGCSPTGAFEENPTTVEIVFVPEPTLNSGGVYTLRIAVSGEGPGNNAGLVSLALQGTLGSGSIFGFSEIIVNRQTQETTLTWNSSPGVSYALDFSADLQVWGELEDGVPSQGTSTTQVVSGPLEAEQYFRVRRE